MNIEIPKFLNDYIEKLTSEFDIEEIWLFGSRANNTATENSDWDMWAFANPEVLTALKGRTDYKSKEIDLMIVYDDNNWEQPWTTIAKTGEERTKHGQLLSNACDFKRIDHKTAEYCATKVIGIEWYYQTFKAYKIWGKNVRMIFTDEEKPGGVVGDKNLGRK